MQSLEASKNYKNSFVCAARIFKDEGVFTFWSGAMPRLVRLIMSGGIVFTMYVVHSLDGCWLMRTRYEKTMETLDSFDPQRKYI